MKEEEPSLSVVDVDSHMRSRNALHMDNVVLNAEDGITMLESVTARSPTRRLGKKVRDNMVRRRKLTQ